MQLTAKTENDEKVMASILQLSPNQNYKVSYDIKKSATKPPKRYTSGSLVLAMENAGKFIEDAELREQIKGSGIGTSATRADIIDKLLRLKYIQVDKKQLLTPTSFGEMIYEVVDYAIPDFLSPDITAEWEKHLTDVAEGKVSKQMFEADIYDYIRKTCDSVKALQSEGIEEVKKRIKTYASNVIRTKNRDFDNWNTKIKCPLCGDDVETTEQ